jgi:hypothetical protein
MNWQMMATLGLHASRADGRSIFIGLQPVAGDWIGIVVESAVERESPEPAYALAKILESHSHCQLPAKHTLSEATKQAEKYVRWWQRTGATAAECPCEVITP